MQPSHGSRWESRGTSLLSTSPLCLDLHGSTELGMDIYEQAEALLRARLVTTAGKVRRNAEACVALGLWLLRRHGPCGAGRQFWVPRLELARNWRVLGPGGVAGAPSC